MFTALISFFGGSVFRTIWGEVSAWITARQDHAFEMERMKLQADMEAAQHARNLEAIKVQADMGVKVIEAQRDADMDKLSAQAFNIAVEATGKPSGVRWVDAWNAAIRPGGATVSILLVALDAFMLVKLDDNLWGVVGAFLGVFVADRTLFKRGK